MCLASFLIVVTLISFSDHLFPCLQIAYMDIHVHIERDIVELVDDGVSTRDGGYASSSSFKIFGKELGITTLYVSSPLSLCICSSFFSCKFYIKNSVLCMFTDRCWNQVSIRQQSGQEIVSQQIKIEVYAPPRIKPDEIFLVPGASYVVSFFFPISLLFQLDIFLFLQCFYYWWLTSFTFSFLNKNNNNFIFGCVVVDPDRRPHYWYICWIH